MDNRTRWGSSNDCFMFVEELGKDILTVFEFMVNHGVESQVSKLILVRMREIRITLTFSMMDTLLPVIGYVWLTRFSRFG